jgi:hypothetical protein
MHDYEALCELQLRHLGLPFVKPSDSPKRHTNQCTALHLQWGLLLGQSQKREA